VRTVKAAIDLLKKVAEEVVTPKYIRSLVDSMPKTYRSIVERKGDWADKKYR
jgi:hypothetical protein